MGQKDVFHKYERNSFWYYPLGLKSAGNNKAILFTIDNYFNSPLDSIASTLYKVDYCGDINKTITVTLPDYDKIMFFDVMYPDSTYIFLATATNIIQNKSYFLTVKSNVNLQGFEIIDSVEIDYPHFGSYQYNSIKNENNNNLEIVFTIGLGYNLEKSAVFSSISPSGHIKTFKTLDLSNHFVNDHYYNSEIKKHFIMSSETIFELDQNYDVINETKIYVMVGEVKKYNFDYRIIFASNSQVVLVGRWPFTAETYIYVVKLNGHGTFEVIGYYPNVFPEEKTYVLRKQYNKDKIVISYSTDDLDTPNDVPNKNYLWEIDKNGNISKQYKIEDDIKRSIEITDIDSEGYLLGTGYEYLEDSNIFFILKDDSKFLVNSQELNNNDLSLDIFPNPSSQFINIMNAHLFEHHAYIYTFDGIKCRVSVTDGLINVSHLQPNMYILELITISSQIPIKRKFIKVQ